MEDYRNNLVVILAGYPMEMKKFLSANPGLHSRFSHQIHFDDYTVRELLSIADLLIESRDYQITAGAREMVSNLFEKELIKNPINHGNGRMVRNIIEEMILAKASIVMNDQHFGDLDMIDEEVVNIIRNRRVSKDIGFLKR